MSTTNPQSEKLRQLNSFLPSLPYNRRTFAASLLDSYKRYRNLSEKQWYWVEKLIEEAGQPVKANTETNIPHAGVIAEMLHKAHSKSNKASIQLIDKNGNHLKLYWRHGYITLYSNGNIAGSLYSDGLFRAHKLDEDQFKNIVLTLTEFAANPAQTAAKHGHAHHFCCFCGLTLTHATSVHVGYGPICAANFGLPWSVTEFDENNQDDIRDDIKLDIATLP